MLELSYPGQRWGVNENDQEYRRVEKELEVIGEIPGPGSTHLCLWPEVIDIEEVPPPELATVGGILHRTEGTRASVEEKWLEEEDQSKVRREESQKSVTNNFQPEHGTADVLYVVSLHEEEIGDKETAEEEERVHREQALLHRLH